MSVLDGDGNLSAQLFLIQLKLSSKIKRLVNLMAQFKVNHFISENFNFIEKDMMINFFKNCKFHLKLIEVALDKTKAKLS